MSLPTAHRTASRAEQGKSVVKPDHKPGNKPGKDDAKNLKPSGPIAENRRARYD